MKLGSRLSIYGQLIRMEAAGTWSSRSNYLLNAVGMLLQIYLLRTVWSAIYGDRTMVLGVSLDLMLAYITIGGVQFWFLSPWTFSVIPERIRSGQIVVDICRPIRFLELAAACQLGFLLGVLPLILLILPITLALFSVSMWMSVSTLVLYSTALMLALVITVLLSILVGLAGFWSPNTVLLFTLYRTISQALAGLSVPLWVMPDWLRYLCELLPFQAILYVPLSILLGRAHHGYTGILVQLLWIVLLGSVASFVWRRIVRRVGDIGI